MVSTESRPQHRGAGITMTGRRPSPRPFDLLVADVRGIHEQFRNHVNPELRQLRAGQRRMDRKLVDIERRFNTIDKKFNAVDKQFSAVDKRFNAVDKRFDAVEERFNAVDKRFDAVEERFNTLEDDIDARFDRVDDSLGHLLRLFSYMMYGGDPHEDEQPALWPYEGEASDEIGEA